MTTSTLTRISRPPFNRIHAEKCAVFPGPQPQWCETCESPIWRFTQVGGDESCSWHCAVCTLVNSCPFCGAKLSGWSVKVADDGKNAFVRCNNCGTQGPRVSVEDEAKRAAARAWAKRKRKRAPRGPGVRR